MPIARVELVSSIVGLHSSRHELGVGHSAHVFSAWKRRNSPITSSAGVPEC